MEKDLEFENPYDSFILAIRSPITRKYLGRLGYFLSYVGIKEGTLENRCNVLGFKSEADPAWLTNNVIKYLHNHRQRVERKEMSASTLINYIKPIKLFCEQLEIALPWKRITRGMPRGRRYANDRIPTKEEIQKIIEYPDRRIKSILYIMASSGIRLGAWNYLKWGHVTPIIRKGKTVAAKIRHILLTGRLSATLIISIEIDRRHGLTKSSNVLIEETENGLIIKASKV